jgi:hypothetical protein
VPRVTLGVCSRIKRGVTPHWRDEELLHLVAMVNLIFKEKLGRLHNGSRVLVLGQVGF